MMIQQTSINHFVDEIIGDRSEQTSCATSYYLLVSNDGFQTTWHQQFSATSVMYTVLTGEKLVGVILILLNFIVFDVLEYQTNWCPVLLQANIFCLP